MVDSKKLVVTIFLITFFNISVILNASDINDTCDFLCEVNDTEPVCVLDKDEVCFLQFPTKCTMERMQCIFGKDYIIYIDTFCKLEGFLCIYQPIIQSPPESSEPHGISYNENTGENTEIVFKTGSRNVQTLKSHKSEESSSDENNDNENDN